MKTRIPLIFVFFFTGILWLAAMETSEEYPGISYTVTEKNIYDLADVMTVGKVKLKLEEFKMQADDLYLRTEKLIDKLIEQEKTIKLYKLKAKKFLGKYKSTQDSLMENLDYFESEGASKSDMWREKESALQEGIFLANIRKMIDDLEFNGTATDLQELFNKF